MGTWRRNRRLAALGGSLTAAALLAVLAAWGWLRPTAPAGFTGLARFTLPVPDSIAVHSSGNAADLAISPDGRLVVHQSVSTETRYQLNLRRIDQLESASIRGPENAAGPFFSFDGEWVGFVDATGGSPLQKVSILGGPPVVLAELPGFRGADWGPDDVIIVGGEEAGLLAVPGGGGEPVALTTPGETESHILPHLIPGNDAIVFTISPQGSNQLIEGRLAVLDRRSGEITELGVSGVSPRYVSSGHIVYAVEDGSLRAVPFDVDALSVTGSPVPLVEGVGVKSSGVANFDISDNGSLVYFSGGISVGGSGGLPLSIVDLNGNAEVLPLAPRTFTSSPTWSSDGRTVAFASESQIYTYDVVLNTTPRQVTFDGDNRPSAFSPDGTWLAFSSVREGTDGSDIFVKGLNESTPPRLVLSMPGMQEVRGWPTDSLIVFESRSSGGLGDLWILDLSNPEAPEASPYLTSEANLRDITVSPDGGLAAYSSDETGSSEIYVRSFPVPGERTVVSQGGDGGEVPLWSPDGRTLYFTTGPAGPVFAARLQRDPVPVVLSMDTLFSGLARARPVTGALHPDGDRFIFAVDGAVGEPTSLDTASGDLTLVLNFFEELRERMGEN